MGSTWVRPIPIQASGKMALHILSATYLEETESLDPVLLIECEAVVNAGGEDEKVAGFHADADPLIGGGFYAESHMSL